MNMPLRWLHPAILLTLILAVSASCGRKTDPLIPASPRPEAVQNVRAVARDAVAFLSWVIPTRNIEGRDIDRSAILGFRIFRAELEADRKKARYKLIAEIVLSNPSPAAVRNGTIFWSDVNVRYGQTYGYRIRAIGVRGALSLPSDEVRVTPLLSLSPPKRLSATGGDSQVTISWEPVKTRADGSVYSGFVGYNVYRGTEKGHQGEIPINREPIRTTTYKDTSVANDTTYYYIVRAVDSPALPWKESLDSPETSAVPRDMTPPARPRGLTVVPGVGRIFLTWNENQERDLAGYYVYRSTKSGREYERLMDRPINRTTHSDETVKPGIMYHYVVSAVDKSGNESALSSGQKASAEKKR